jgi:flagellar biosynthesis protein FlhF
MRIKKYTAKSMKEALLQIKQDLGEEAIILKTSHVHGKLFSQGDIEVTAAVDEESRKDASVSHQAFAPLRVANTGATGVYKRPKPAPELPRPLVDKQGGAQERRRAGLEKAGLDRAGQDNELDKKYETLKADLGELKRMFAGFVTSGEIHAEAGFSGDWALLHKKLVEAEVPADVAQEFIERINRNRQADVDAKVKAGDVVQRFVNELNDCFPSNDSPPHKPGRHPRVIMFVGPTGSGKTTTLAKLAAQQALGGRASVSLITSDTYRIAAIEQIRTFAEIMNMPLHIVFSPAEADKALAACASSDVVFVDTAGRSQKSSEHMEELSALIKQLAPDEIHCVLSAGTKVSDLIAALEKYGKLGANRLLFTKLDETMKLGNVFAAGVKSKIPFSYFTFGQRVPDDIERAQPHRLVTRLFERGKA